jgi:predicted metalloprotease with PDZ domain
MPPPRPPERITDRELQAALRRTPATHYVIWTGHHYRNKHGSLRSQAMRHVTEIMQPVAVTEMLRRAARADGEIGFDPATARSGLRLHQGARPAVYLLVERDPVGDFRAVTEIPQAGPLRVRIPAGSVVMDRTGRFCLDAAGKPRR